MPIRATEDGKLWAIGDMPIWSPLPTDTSNCCCEVSPCATCDVTPDSANIEFADILGIGIDDAQVSTTFTDIPDCVFIGVGAYWYALDFNVSGNWQIRRAMLECLYIGWFPDQVILKATDDAAATFSDPVTADLLIIIDLILIDSTNWLPRIRAYVVSHWPKDDVDNQLYTSLAMLKVYERDFPQIGDSDFDCFAVRGPEDNFFVDPGTLGGNDLAGYDGEATFTGTSGAIAPSAWPNLGGCTAEALLVTIKRTSDDEIFTFTLIRSATANYTYGDGTSELKCMTVGPYLVTLETRDMMLCIDLPPIDEESEETIIAWAGGPTDPDVGCFDFDDLTQWIPVNSDGYELMSIEETSVP